MISIIINLPGDQNHSYNPEVFKPNSRNRQRLTSVASMRLQFFPLLDVLRSENIKAKIYNISSENFNMGELTRSERVLVLKLSPLSQHSATHKNALELNNYAKKKLNNILVYYGDNYMATNSNLSLIYQNVIKNCTAIASHSSYLNQIAKSLNKHAKISEIPDPCLLTRQPFLTSNNQKECRIIWFGQGANLTYLLESLGHIMKNCHSCKKFRLTILTRRSYFDQLIIPKLKEIKSSPSAAEMPASWNIRLVPWNDETQPQQLEEELGKADISFIPSDPSNPWKKGASANRLVDSIQSGCITVCSPLESYRDFKTLTLQGQDFANLIDQAWRERTSISRQIEVIRENALDSYSQKIIQQKWLDFLV